MRYIRFFAILILFCPSIHADEAWTHIAEIDGETIGMVRNVFVSSDDEVWVSCFSPYNLYHFYANEWHDESEHTNHRYIPDMAEAPNGDIWFCSGEVLLRYDGTDWHILEDVPYSTQCIGIDNENTVWCGTDHGVLHYVGSDWILHTTEDGLASNGVTHLVVSPDGVPWIRYGEPLTENQFHGGVSWYTGDHWETYTLDDGLYSNIIDDIAFDKNGYVYVSHQPIYGASSGISRYNGNSWEFLFEKSGKLLFDTENNLWVTNYVYDQVYKYDGMQWKEYTHDTPWYFRGQADSDKSGMVWFGTDNGIVILDDTITMVQNELERPQSFSLLQNYPNPFNPSTTINFAMNNPSHVTLSVYSITGQKVATLIDGTIEAGSHKVVFDGSGLGSGMYFYRFETPGIMKTGKMLLMK